MKKVIKHHQRVVWGFNPVSRVVPSKKEIQSRGFKKIIA